MENPVSITGDEIKIKSDLMEKEKLYHCLYKNKVLLVFKDDNDILNCYEIEDSEIVEKFKNCQTSIDVENLLEEYIQTHDLKN